MSILDKIIAQKDKILALLLVIKPLLTPLKELAIKIKSEPVVAAITLVLLMGVTYLVIIA